MHCIKYRYRLGLCHIDLAYVISGSYKTRNGTEPEVIDAQYRRRHQIRNMSAHQCTESSSRVLYQPRRWDKHPADSIKGPSLTSEGSVMSLPSLGLAVGSRFTCGSPRNREWYRFLYYPQIRNQASPQSVHFHFNIQ